MKSGTLLQAFLTLCCFVAVGARAAIVYVDADSISPVAPYTNWATAAAVIQDAVDVAAPGDTVLVADGIYDTGGKAVYGTMTNRVAVDKPLTLLSVNGPESTSIHGYQVPGTTNGPAAIRGVYLTNGALLSGFTVTGGATQTSGEGAAARVRFGGGLFCDSTNAWASNCVFVSNVAHHRGGGVFSGTLFRCTITSNTAVVYGGGASQSTLNNCRVTDNWCINQGGGAFAGRLHGCSVTGNSALNGGGCYESVLTHCTVVGNTATLYGGGTYTGSATNCIILWNHAANPENFYFGNLDSCCTTPVPGIAADGNSYVPKPNSSAKNIVANPQLASPTHLSGGSPCIVAGSSTFAIGTDIDGEPWASPPSIGCDEYWAGSLTGLLSVAINATDTTVAAGFAAEFNALVEGRPVASTWDFGDGVIVSNQPWISHAWSTPGLYPLVLTAYNLTVPAGISATTMVQVIEPPVHYVAANGTNATPPYSSWSTAATNLQDAVDAANVRGALVLVTNGVYDRGARAVYGTTTNRLVVDKPIKLLSVNGPEVTTIKGAKLVFTAPPPKWTGVVVRCVYMARGAVLSGFTLTNGSTGGFDTLRENSGAGAWCASGDVLITNCLITGNEADDNRVSFGGGAFSGRLVDCALIGNSSRNGGGAYRSILESCLLATNDAGLYAGGADASTLSNCWLVGNTARYGGGTSVSSLTGCTLLGNRAYNGGGAVISRLQRCAIIGNLADGLSGGAGRWLTECVLVSNVAMNRGGACDGADLWNCTLVGNSAPHAGGAFGSKLHNSIVLYNTATASNANYEGCSFEYSCTTPLPAAGLGNITNTPLFADTNAWTDLRLQSNSPCINAGKNVYALTSTDLDGDSRIAGGTVDMGAYEYPYPQSTISYAYLQQYGLPIDGSIDDLDLDFDSQTTWQEWKAWTDPTDPLSVLQLLGAAYADPGVLLRWSSEAGAVYDIERALESASSAAFNVLATNLTGRPLATTFRDGELQPDGSAFYRVGTASTNLNSPIAMDTPEMLPAGVNVEWSSVSGQTYFVERRTNLVAAFSLLQSNLVGKAGTTIFVDTTATNGQSFYYRVGVPD